MRHNLHMYILSGMSFAGKSVLARAISYAKQVEIVDPDAVAHAKGLGLHGEFLSATVWRAIHHDAEDQAKRLLCSGKSVVYDTTAFNKQQRDALREIAKACGATPVIIIVSITREEAFKRWQANTISKQRALVHSEDFQMCADEFTFPTHDEEYLIYRAGENMLAWIENNLQ